MKSGHDGVGVDLVLRDNCGHDSVQRWESLCTCRHYCVVLLSVFCIHITLYYIYTLTIQIQQSTSLGYHMVASLL